MPELRPWDLHRDLTEDRLVAVAGFIARGRSEALDRYEPEVGDNPWTLGCRGYAFARFQIEKAIGTGKLDWLQVVDIGQQFTFRIGVVPVRFYRGDADEPHARTLQQSYPELRQLELALGDGQDLNEMIFRFAVETGFDGELLRIVFVAMQGPSVECRWEIPLSAAPAVLHPLDDARSEGVALPAPRVRLPDEEDEQQEQQGQAADIA